MDREKISELLDKSCADALDDWKKGREIDRQRASEAMTALGDGLKAYIRPDYDSEYMPPAYVIRYQLGHVYKAWKALSRLKDEMDFGTRGRDTLRIVDFGAGTSVGRIGAALMAAEAIEDGRSIDRIFFEEIDTSPLMLGMGTGIWRALTQEVQRNFAETALARAVKIIKGGQNKNWELISRDDRDTWLTAFHVTYSDNDDLKEVINGLYQSINPIGGAFSCHEGNLERMREIFPFHPVYEWNSGYYPKHEGKPNGGVQCSTAHISDWAVKYGFWQNRNMRPYLQVRACAILVGPDIPF